MRQRVLIERTSCDELYVALLSHIETMKFGRCEIINHLHRMYFSTRLSEPEFLTHTKEVAFVLDLYKSFLWFHFDSPTLPSELQQIQLFLLVCV